MLDAPILKAMNETARDVALRTFANDAIAVGKNQKPQAEIVSMGAMHAMPTQQAPADAPLPEPADQKKHGRLVLLTVGIVLLLALAGYFTYLLLQ